MNPRRLYAALAALLALSGTLAAAPVPYQGYTFDAYVQRSDGMRFREYRENGNPTLKVRPDEEYSIVVRNPLPVRAAVAVTIDGLNSIDGLRTSPRNAKKWILEPNSSMTIKGWQTGGSSLRKFLFTRQESTYAQWREGKEGKAYTKNLGVIGVAWFWNRAELDAALHPPQPFKDDASMGGGLQDRMNKSAAAPSAAPRAEGRAGTGMGRQERNDVTEVEFNGDAGMFSVRDVLKIFYEFAKDPQEPLPFVNEGEENERFAPDMYK